MCLQILNILINNISVNLKKSKKGGALFLRQVVFKTKKILTVHIMWIYYSQLVTNLLSKNRLSVGSRSRLETWNWKVEIRERWNEFASWMFTSWQRRYQIWSGATLISGTKTWRPNCQFLISNFNVPWTFTNFFTPMLFNQLI